MEIYEASSDDKEEWNDLVENSDDAWFFHLFEFYNIPRSKPHYFIIRGNDNILGILPTVEEKNKLFKWLYAAPHRASAGFALSPDIGKKYKRRILTSLFEFVRQFAKNNGFDYLQVPLSACAPAYLPLKQNVNPLIFYDFKDISSYTCTLSLKKSLDDLGRGLDKKCRNIIRKAEKNNLKITEGESLADTKEFQKIRVESAVRTGGHPGTFEEAKFWYDNFISKGLGHLFFAEYEREKIGCILIWTYKNSAAYGAGVSKGDYLNLGVNNLLQWHAIKWAKDKGYEWYDFTGVNPTAHSKKMKGISHFKMSFGGEIRYYWSGIQYYWSPYKPLVYNLGTTIKDFMSEVAGGKKNDR